MKIKKIVISACLSITLILSNTIIFASDLHTNDLVVNDKLFSNNSTSSYDISYNAEFNQDISVSKEYDNNLILGKYTLDEVSKIINISSEELKSLKEENNHFDEIISSAIDISKGTKDPSFRMATTSSVGSVGIDNIRSYVKPGDMHITPINKTNGVRHGHAALAYNPYYNIEIHGEGTVSSLSSNSGWGDYSAYRLYRTNIGETNAFEAAYYAYKNLRGLPYKGLASVQNQNEVNCASLVWKAFNDSGQLTLGNPGPLPYAPKHITLSTNVDWVISYGWDYI